MRTLLVSALMLMLALAMIAGCSQQQEEPADTNGQTTPQQEPAPVYQDTTPVDTLGTDTMMTPDTGATGM